jgi:TRAP-type C4-dicarboxylate transport system substrate-binding protein
MVQITRRTALAGATALALGSAPAAYAQAKPKLRFSCAFSETDLRAEGYKAFAAAMKDEFDLEPYWSNTLFKQGTELVALQRENLELCNLAPADISKQIPAWSLMTSAYLFRDYDHLKKTFASDVGQEFIKMARDQLGIEVIRPVYFGARQVNLKPGKKINTPADLAGVKLRMPGGPDWLLLAQSIGATPTPMGMPEVYVALQTGTIDGQENPPTIFNAAKFSEVSKQMVLTSHLVQPIFYAIAKPWFDKLNPGQQKKLRDAAVLSAKWNDDNRLNDEKTVIDGLAAKGLTVSRPDLAPFRANADKVYAGAEAAKAWDRKLMEEVMAVR